MPNPWMSMYLSAANSWAGAMRGLWTAEFHRQQTAAANAMIRQATDFWTKAWTAPLAGSKPKRRR